MSIPFCNSLPDCSIMRRRAAIAPAPSCCYNSWDGGRCLMGDRLLAGKRVLLGVTGGIAAYKAADLCSKLVQAGAQVDVVMTEAATRFVAPLTFGALCGRAARVDMWAASGGAVIPHVQ